MNVEDEEIYATYSVQCTVHSVQCTVYSAQCTVQSVEYKVQSVKCTLHSEEYRRRERGKRRTVFYTILQ